MLRFYQMSEESFAGRFRVYRGGTMDSVKDEAGGTFTSEIVAPVPLPAALPLLVTALGTMRILLRRRPAA